jgi:O-antigen ligase
MPDRAFASADCSLMEKDLALAGMDLNVVRSRSSVNELLLAKVALFILFFGEGMETIISYVIQYSSLNVPYWIENRFNILVSVPAIIIGITYYFSYSGIAKSKTVIGCILWMTVSLTWLDPTEIGRGTLLLTQFLITLPIATVIVRTNYQEKCILWFCGTFVLSMLFVIFSNADYILDRFGDISENGVVVMNSNGVGLMAICVLLLIYRLYEERRFSVKQYCSQSKFIYQIVLPCFSVCAFLVFWISISRTAAVILAILLFIIVAKHIKENSTTIVYLLLVLPLTGYLLFDSEIVTAWSERFFSDDVSTFNGRIDIWQSGWSMASLSQFNWIHGLGLGGVDKFLGYAMNQGVIHPRDGILRLHSHNLYLEWLMELGFVGAVLGIYLCWTMFRIARRLDIQNRSINRQLILIYLAIYSFSGVPIKAGWWPAIGSLVWAILTPKSTK